MARPAPTAGSPSGALNLSAIFGNGTCVGDFGTINMRSRSSETTTSALKDWVAPVPVSVKGNCGGMVISKRDQYGNLVGGATFKIVEDPRPGQGGTGTSFTIKDNDVNDANPVPGVTEIKPVQPSTYVVTETVAPPGYLLPAPGDASTTVVVPPNGNGTFTFIDAFPYQPLTATKTATATYDADYDWTITKTASPLMQTVPSGTSATTSYAVTVTAGDEQRKNHAVTGTVKIANPNAGPVVVTLSDALSDETTCAFADDDVSPKDAGLQVSVPAGGADFAYTCTATASTASGTNTATISWSRADYPQTQADVDSPGTAPKVTLTPKATYSFTRGTRTDTTVDVTDVLDGGSATDLGTLDWDTIYALPGHRKVFTYTHTFADPAGTCTTHDNRATVTETGSKTTRSASAQSTVCVAADLTVRKNAVLTYDRAYDWAIDKSAPTTVFAGVSEDGTFSADVRYTIGLEALGMIDSNVSVAGTITVTNPNDFQAITTDVTDTVTINGTAYPCTVTDSHKPIPAGKSVDLPYTCDNIASSTDGDYSGTNKATATWDAAAAHTPTGTANSGPMPVAVMEDATPTNKSVTVTDPMTDPAGPFDWDDVHAEPNHTHTITYNKTLGTTAGACKSYDNTATIVQTDETASASTEVCSPGVSKDSTAVFGHLHKWQVVKAVDKTSVEVAGDGTATFHYTVTATPDGLDETGWQWSGRITVTNPSKDTPLAVDVTDISGVAKATCEVIDGAGQVVPADETATFVYQCTTTDDSVHPQAGAGATNTAHVAFGNQYLEDTIPVVFTQAHPANENATIDVQDTKNGDALVSLGTASWNSAGEPTVFEYDWTSPPATPGKCTAYDNTALVPGDTATVGVDVCGEAPLEVTKTADGSFTRTYKWRITKDADETKVEIAEGDTHKFGYHVTATPDGYTDSAWEIHGTISVHNPNTYSDGDITTTVTDRLTDITGGVCKVTDGIDVVVAATKTVTLDYTCTFAQEPTDQDYDGTNVAMASWTDPAGSAASATGSVAATMTATKVNDSVDVHDDWSTPGEKHLLGTATWADGAKTFDYSVTLAGVASKCTTYTNTAVIKQTTQTASDEVELCVQKAPTITKEANTRFTRTYGWKLTKSVDHQRVDVDPKTGKATLRYQVAVDADGFTDSDWHLSGYITVANENTYATKAPMSITLTDLPVGVGGGVECTVDDGGKLLLPPNTRTGLGYDCTFDGKPTYTGGTNVAHLSFTPAGATAPTTINSEPVPVTFERPGEQTRDVQIVDDKTVPGTSIVLGELSWKAGMHEVYDYDLDLDGKPGTCVDYDNTAAVLPTGEGSGGDNRLQLSRAPDSALASDEVQVTVCSPLDLTLDKTVAASFDRTYRWAIDKVADKTEVNLTADQSSAQVTYHVTATPGVAVDSGHELSGRVTVTNPNDYFTAPARLTDTVAVGNGAVCDFVGGVGDLSVPPEESVSVPYACTFDPAGTYADGTNKVSVTWGEGRSTSLSVPVAFALDKETNKTVTVIDDKTNPGATPVTLGEATWNRDSKPVDFSYELALAAEPGGCRMVDNTATLVETDQKDKVGVKVCRDKPSVSVTPTPTPSPTTTAIPPTVTPTVTPTVDPTHSQTSEPTAKPTVKAVGGQQLPATGAAASLRLLLVLGLGLLAVGATLVAARRRREC